MTADEYPDVGAAEAPESPPPADVGDVGDAEAPPAEQPVAQPQASPELASWQRQAQQQERAFAEQYYRDRGLVDEVAAGVPITEEHVRAQARIEQARARLEQQAVHNAQIEEIFRDVPEEERQGTFIDVAEVMLDHRIDDPRAALELVQLRRQAGAEAQPARAGRRAPSEAERIERRLAELRRSDPSGDDTFEERKRLRQELQALRGGSQPAARPKAAPSAPPARRSERPRELDAEDDFQARLHAYRASRGRR